MSQAFDVIIESGLVFDGKASPAIRANVGVKGGKVAALSTEPLPKGEATRVIDASGKWVMPGFIDLHTHYDAEVEVAPALSESLRHGVTTVALGSCSLSLALGDPDDLADMFCRVEAIPDDIVRPLLRAKKDWRDHREYFEHLSGLPLGPNVASFAGHSAIRTHVMGIDRAIDPDARPTEPELRRMEGLLNEALDEGYMGLSIQTLPWDKMGGDRYFRSRPLPSTFGRWSEYRRLTRVLRERDAIFQGVPNVSTKINVILFLLESAGLARKPLRTTVISLMDLRDNRLLYKAVPLLSRLFNTKLGADFRWQALPEVFDLWADGADLVVFEEFGAGAAALHLKSASDRAALFRDPAYRARFRREWTSKLLPRVFHRDFNQSEILACPDARLVGRSFADIARERGDGGGDATATFLDLIAEHGPLLRWYTVMANDRRGPLEEIVTHPDILVGFSDAGAHLRNMAHYNFPLRMLRLARDAELRGEPFMPIEQAVFRLTSEIGAWLGIDAGELGVGKRADIAVIDPAGLDASLDAIEEAPIAGYGGFVRLVRRNPRAVPAVLVNGALAVLDGEVLPEIGSTQGLGQVLRATRSRSNPRGSA